MASDRTAGRAVGHVTGNFGAWTVAAIASLAYVAVCSRIFAPATIGGYAAGVVVESVTYLAVGSGLAVAVQRRERVERVAESEYMGRAILAGAASAVLLIVGADWWAQLWEAPSAAGFTRVFAAVALVHAAAQVALGTLRGRGLHGEAAAVTAFAGVGAATLGVIPVLLTHEPLTLVASNALVWLLVLAASARKGVRLAPRFTRSLPEGRFARSTVMLNVVNFVAYNLPAWSVSRYISVATLGLYSRTWLLADLPAQGMSAAATQALFPSFARMPIGAGKALATDALAGVSAVSAVLLAGIAALASLLVPLLLGEGWRSAIPLLAVLGITLSAMPPQLLLTSFLQGRGDFRALVTSRLVGLAVAGVFAVLVAVSGDPLVAAAGAGAVHAAAYAAALMTASRLGVLQTRSVLAAHLATALACLPLWIIAAVQAADIWQPRSAGEIVLLVVATGAAAGAAGVITLRGRTGQLLEADGRLPSWLQHFTLPNSGRPSD